MKGNKLTLLIIYSIIGFAIFPILQFEYFRNTPILDQASAFWVSFRIIFTGPILLVTGFLLVFLVGGNHRIFGGIVFVIGIYWIVRLIQAMV